MLYFFSQHIVLNQLLPKQEYEFLIAAKSAKGSGKFTDPVSLETKQLPSFPPILVSKKLPAPLVGVTLRWTSKAQAIERFKLRYAKEVEKITNKTLLKKLQFVEKTFPSSDTAYNATNLGLYHN